jgi:hypothetical protein
MHSLKRAFRAEGHIICALTYSERQTTAVHIVFFAIYKIHGHIKSIIHILLKPKIIIKDKWKITRPVVVYISPYLTSEAQVTIGLSLCER